MIAQLRTTAAIADANLASHILHTVTEDNLYLASLWATNCGIMGTDSKQTKIFICVVPPNITINSFANETNNSLRAHGIIWNQDLFLGESFNIAGMALPKGTKIYVGAGTKNVVFTMTGTGM